MTGGPDISRRAVLGGAAFPRAGSWRVRLPRDTRSWSMPRWMRPISCRRGRMWRGLIYPVINLDSAFTHVVSRTDLLGADAPTAKRSTYSVDKRVSAATPPMFLVHAADDGLVPVANTLALYEAMLDAKRPAKLHDFDKGGHGFGARLPRAVPTSAWPSLFATFAARKGVFA